MRNIFFSLLAICLFVACYDDESTLPVIEYPSVVANKSGEPQFLVTSYGAEFTYEPRLCRMVGRDTVPLTTDEFKDYSYEWEITLLSDGNDTTRQILSNERILKTTIQSLPTTSSQFSYYNLTLHVTHIASQVKKNLLWKVKVLGAYGTGLLVAETRDGKKSDLSIVMSRTYNNDIQDYESDVVHHNAYSRNNDNTQIDGVVSALTYVTDRKSYSDIMALVEGKSLVRIDPVSMKLMNRDMECFYYAPKVFYPEVIFESWNRIVLINNGLVQYYEARYGNKFSVDMESRYNLAKAYVGKLGYVDAIFFDKNAEKFVQFSVRNKEVMDLGPVEAGKFDPNDMKGFECIYGGVGNDNTARWLMKKEGHYYVYEMDQVSYKGLNVYDLENCPDIGKSPCFAFSESNPEFYYSVDNVLYVVPLSGDKPTRLTSYDKFGTNEKITHLLFHTGDGYTTWSEETDPATGKTKPFWRSSANNVMTVVTYDGKEGRVYTLPIQYGGSGGIAPDKYVRCYDKFGEITGIGMRN